MYNNLSRFKLHIYFDQEFQIEKYTYVFKDVCASVVHGKVVFVLVFGF